MYSSHSLSKKPLYSMKNPPYFFKARSLTESGAHWLVIGSSAIAWDPPILMSMPSKFHLQH